MIRVLELRSVRGTGGGPEKTILFGAALTDASRFAITVCYVRDTRDDVYAIDRRARAAAVDFVEIEERHSFDPRIVGRLQALLSDRRIDVVHSHDYKTDLLAWMVAGRCRSILATAHGWTGHSGRERRLYYPLDRRLLARFPRVIAVSSDVRNALLRSGARADRVTVLLNGIDANQFRRDSARVDAIRTSLGLSATSVVIGAVGRLERQKRFDLLLEAFARLRRDRPDVRLLIAGDGSLRAALTQRIASLGLTGACQILGHRDDIESLHHAFDIFVQSSEYEGTPNAVLEAMALETPIVATDAGGTAEVARPDLDGLIVPAGDVDALVSAISRTLDDSVARRSRVRAARKRVETDLSFEARTRALERIYLELVGPEQWADPPHA
jgi:glycosyltransferase involved in cell wall biosynthesis